MDGKQIGLGKWVVQVEDFGEKIDEPGGVLKSPVALILEATGSIDAHRKLPAVIEPVGMSLNVLKVAHCPSEQVSAHHRGCLKSDPVPPILGEPSVLDRHVAEGTLVDGDLNLKVKACLKVGLVKAWKGTAGIARLKLGAEHVVPCITVRNRLDRCHSWFIFTAVKAGHFVVYDPFKLDAYSCHLGNGQLLVEDNSDALSWLIICESCGFYISRRLCLIQDDLRMGQPELETVERDLAGAFDNLDIDSTERL
jgi:hypothetical protein